MWYIADQEAIKQLNEAVNEQFELVQHLQELSRWHSKLREDALRLRENVEAISEALNEAIVWRDGHD